jgi:hypothetical protein
MNVKYKILNQKSMDEVNHQSVIGFLLPESVELSMEILYNR